METTPATAVFEERAAMEDAVREIVAMGIRPRDIHISETAARVQQRTRASVITFGFAIGAATGIALSLVWIWVLTATVSSIPLSFVMVRAIMAALSAGLLGALVGVLFRGSRVRGAEEDEVSRASRGFVVTVEPSTEGAAAEVRRLLALHDGALVSA